MSIFDEQLARKPNKYPWTQDFINAMWEGHWTPNIFSFKSDLHDYKTILSTAEKDIVVKTLSAIAQIEIAVKKFWSRLGDNLPHPSIVDMGLVMANVEVIHNQSYQKLLDILGLDSVFEENLKTDVIGGRVSYLRKYLDKVYKDNRKQYIYSLILFTLFVENVSLFSQFYIVMWFGRYKNVLKDANQQVMYVRNEEKLHSEIGIKLINTIHEESPELFDKDLEDKVVKEAKNAFKCECNIIEWILGDFQGERINRKILEEYLKYKLNHSLTSIGYPKLYDIDPLLYRDFEWFIEETSGNFMTDFFVRLPTEYSKNTKSYEEDDLF